MSPQPPIFTFNQSARRDRRRGRRVARAKRCADPRLALSEAAFLEVKRQQSSGADDVVPLGEWRVAGAVARAHERHRLHLAPARDRRPLRARRRRQLRPPRVQVRLAHHRAPHRDADVADADDAAPRERVRPAGARRARRRQRADRDDPLAHREGDGHLRPDAPLEPRLGGVRLRARARRPAAGDLRRGKEPLHEPRALVLHAQPRRLPRSTAASSTASTRRCSRPTRA